MHDEELRNDEVLYRAIHPVWLKPGHKKPTSAAFKQSTGVSVDRDGGREEQTIIDVFENRRPGFGLASITAEECRNLDTFPVPKPLPDNEYHAEIHNSETRVKLSPSKAKKLSEAVRIVRYPSATLRS